MDGYRRRVMDDLLKKKLQAKGAVLIEGPKWCGKTTTAEEIAASKVLLARADVKSNFKSLLEIDADAALSGEAPMLIDEWQTVPKLWDAVRYTVDHRRQMGQFILTGSSVPVDEEKRRHSGTGRFGWIKMRPMSLWESGDSTGKISLSDLFNGQIFEPFECSMELEQLAFLVCRGGWPQASFMEGDLALEQARDYYEAIYKIDIHRVDKVRRSSERTRLLLRSYARNTGSATSFSKMCEDIKANDNASITYESISDYVDALKKLFVLEDMPAWNPNLRSKAAIQSSDTRYFVDPSIATSALSLGPKDLINDLKTFGLFFESLAVRDLRTYADALGGELYHFRDSSGLECDAVLHLRNGEYALIEIKLGGKANIDKGAESLLTLAARIDTDKMKAPSFLMVLTGVCQYAYRRPDGVFVVPVGSLKD